MSELGRFLPEDRDLLAGLFYRVGLWVSRVDDTDVGEESENREHARLLAVLQGLAERSGTPELVRELAGEASRQKASWPRWGRGEETILTDVTAGLRLLKRQGTTEETSSFQKSLMFVGTAVARAYREEADGEKEEKGKLSWLSDKAGELLTSVLDREAWRDLSISPAEDTALTNLLDALKR